MATFFGEIVPSASRAVDDDEDDEEEKGDTRSFSVKWLSHVTKELQEKTDKKVPCDTLIIALGDTATSFIESYVNLADDEVIGQVQYQSEDEVNTEAVSQISRLDKSCLIYRCKRNRGTLICQCKSDVLPEHSYSWVSQCFSGINLSKAYVCILCSTTTSEYMSEKHISDMKPPFVRSLSTTRFAGTPSCPYLEQPNIVSGLPAQILTFCEMNNIRAVIYICYSDYMFLDFAAIKAFKVVLNSTPFRNSIQVNPKAEEMVRSVVETHDAHNSLYL